MKNEAQTVVRTSTPSEQTNRRRFLWLTGGILAETALIVGVGVRIRKSPDPVASSSVPAATTAPATTLTDGEFSSFFGSRGVYEVQKLAVEVTGGREAAWVRFFGLYTPAIRRFVEWNDKTHDPDDVIQDVYLKLVDILQSGKYNPDKARFRTFLALLIRRQLISLYRHDQARGGDRNISLDSLENGRACAPRGPLGLSTPPPELSVPATQPTDLDLKWVQAKHAAAVEHVLTKTALSTQSKQVYKAHVLEGRSAAEVAAAFGITKNLVGQIKFRVDKAIAIIEEEYADVAD